MAWPKRFVVTPKEENGSVNEERGNLLEVVE